MAKSLPRITRPGRAVGRSAPNPPAYSPLAMQVGGMLRGMVIGFWFVVMLLVWLMPNDMGIMAQLLVTVCISLIGAMGLLMLNRIRRKAIREQRCAAGCCLECGSDLRGTPDRCPECGMIPRHSKEPDIDSS
jgi:hypothetical protein